MKALKHFTIVLAGFFLFAGCAKELSYETGFGKDVASGSLKDTFGNCLPVTIKGNYVRNRALTDSNFLTVLVNFSAPGRYAIATDTANGFSFSAAGVTADSGLQSITLKGIGTPRLAQQTNFLVKFDTSVCTFSIAVTDSAITPPVTSNDYFPTTDSSNWTYENTQNADSVLVQVDKNNILLEGNTYRIFTNTYEEGDTDSAFYRKGNGLYYTYSDFNELDIYSQVEKKTDYIFLKDNVAAGSTWESPEINATFASAAGKAKIRFTIANKDIQTSTGNITFDSVIQVKREYLFASSNSAGTYLPVVTGNFYYAKNLGFVKAETAAPFSLSLFVTRLKIYY